ncbi:MAG: hypothetical protein ABF289_18150 [Clostridiales bacterium]
MSKLFSIFLNTEKRKKDSVKKGNTNEDFTEFFDTQLNSWVLTEEDSTRIEKFIERQNQIEKEIIESDLPF